MHKKSILLIVILALTLAGCAADRAAGSEENDQKVTEIPTMVPNETTSPTLEPSPTETLPPTPTAVPPTSTPEVVCRPGSTIHDSTLDVLPGYGDIVQVSTTLEGETLTVIFRLKNLPAEIAINQAGHEDGQFEYDWGVAIDKDNNPETGWSAPAGRKAFEARLEAVHIKMGAEKTGDIESLFLDKVQTWEREPSSGSSNFGCGSISVNLEQNTITLSGTFSDIPEDAYLVFYAMGEGSMDVICDRNP
jgi:hypothetical protein